MSTPKVVLITGASSGNGQAIAQLLAEQGHQVFGTSRNPPSSQTPSNYKLLALDVCSEDSVKTFVESVLKEANRIDVLVNNAGYEQGGALEEISLDEARAQFETNLFGVARMVRAVLPTMRQQKQGQIINISSLAGIVAVPFLGMYSASKFALEGYSEALRHEVKPFNIQVSLVEAGFLNTPLRTRRQSANQPIAAYDVWRKRAFGRVLENEEQGPPSRLVAETALKIIEDKAPRLRYIIGKEARLTSRLRRWMPQSAFEQGTRRSFGLDKEA